MTIDRDLSLVLCRLCGLFLYWEPLPVEFSEDPVAGRVAAGWRAVTLDPDLCKHQPTWEDRTL